MSICLRNSQAKEKAAQFKNFKASCSSLTLTNSQSRDRVRFEVIKTLLTILNKKELYFPNQVLKPQIHKKFSLNYFCIFFCRNLSRS